MPITYQDSNHAPEFIMEQLKDLRGIKSSEFAKKAQDELLEKGVLPKLENHEWARLCIAYHFSKEPNMSEFVTPAPDIGGREIPSLSTCFQSEWRFWLALIVDSMPNFDNPTSQIEIGQITKRINDHWHQGAILLKDRYDKLCLAYPNRYDSRLHWLSELANITKNNIGAKLPIPAQLDKNLSEDEDISKLQAALGKIGLIVDVPDPISGVRYDRYTIQMKSFADVNKLEKNLDNLTSELGVATDDLRLERCDDGRPNSVYLNYLRSESTWGRLGNDKFIASLDKYPSNMDLPVCVGADEMGEPVFEDLCKAPHVFVGGATNSGKSVCVHGMIQSLLHNKNLTQLQVALFDPKRVELSPPYRNHPNLWRNQIFVDDIAEGLEELVIEMDSRYKVMEGQGVNNIAALPKSIRPPYIVVVVDELADLVMSNDGKDMEDNLVKLAQKARACGIHLILATQRPDSQTFKGLLRANLTARIALKVQTSSNSRIILDETGAEILAGKGDRLIKWGGATALRHGYSIKL